METAGEAYLAKYLQTRLAICILHPMLTIDDYNISGILAEHRIRW